MSAEAVLMLVGIPLLFFLAWQVKKVGERLHWLEEQQSALRQSLQGISTDLARTGTLTGSLQEVTHRLGQELSRALEVLAELRGHTHAQAEKEGQMLEVLRRLELVLAGSRSKGAAGENILDLLFSQLPPEWQVRNFRVGNRVVEFGLRLPNGLVLPIDSKWPATNLLEEFHRAEDAEKRQRIRRQIEEVVVAKARELKKYLDPSLTPNFGLVVVPDAVFELSSGVQPLIYQFNVVLVSYSLFLPYLLLIYQVVLRYARSLDLRRLDAALSSLEEGLRGLQEEVEGRMARALTMLTNSQQDMRVWLGRVAAGLSSLRSGVTVAETDEAERIFGTEVE
ncbi:protein of unknown function DUF195 [Ammonifex degensii KC4]|uniref:DNA recombination protein RmuC n=2 Tax=Ammonifex degensii TaxID=42838 RepID=C9R8R5_AMMDK|nr:protein of unknown function DUF195 [Ammonifex degensii KC4]